MPAVINRERLEELYKQEQQTFIAKHPKSKVAYESAHHLFGKVPMSWMNKRAGGFPLYLDKARGNTIYDIDGNEYIDFALGDTGAMAGHSAQPVVDAVVRRVQDLGGLTTMLPTEDAEWVGKNLSERFGMAKWSFSLTATDANRWAIRLVRAYTNRKKILVNSYCYHGSVDESLIVVGPDGEGMERPGNVGAPVDVTITSRVAEFNDLEGLERQLKHGDVAAVLMEPAMTNIGIILPEPGYLKGVRELTRKYGTLLMIDETHSFSAGYGGMTLRDGLEPDVFIIGKAIAGGVPTGAYGLSADFAAHLLERPDLDLIDMGGVGGTLAGNPVQIGAMRATLEHVLTKENFDRMIALCDDYTQQVQALFDKYDLPWSINQLGARAEYRFAKPYPKNGTEACNSSDGMLEDFLHVYLANRGIMLTPFHNMALMCPTTKKEEVDRHTEVFEAAIRALLNL